MNDENKMILSDISYINIFKELGNFNENSGETNIVVVNDIKNKLNKNVILNFSWLFPDHIFGKQYKSIIVYQNNHIVYLWNVSYIEKNKIEQEVINFRNNNNFPIKCGNYPLFVKLCGLL